MGMNLYGEEPLNKTGEYLRYSVRGWYPLAEYVLATAPEELTGKCRYWYTNDGDGLNAEDSRALAALLGEEIDSGRAEAYVLMRARSLESLPDDPCFACDGTGKQESAVCHVCKGTGKVRPSDTYYHLDLESVAKFRDFLFACGGFRIH